ncbi:glycerophosphoryl diester phosphodiesterase family protein [Roseobacter denitrificans OCh 114]|uniref:Glycerophosphoryl diester phosphodiesterase family protein n=2 Tax=Roseobacter denitrificans TaxID=2434 RepID=Q16DB1_ROSDO|nr:glycerophosphoryl diester phosphodiesterase family protein [Roseobacter denitrificans OCh 114]
MFVRLIIAAVLVPLIAALLAITLSFSDQSALTDQDIARFLLTPVGAIGAVFIASLIIVAATIDIAVMTAVLRSDQRGAGKALAAAFGFLTRSLPRLAVFAGHLLVRVLVISLPFLAVAGAIALFLMRDFDINYYLANRPPAFMAAIASGGVIAVALALVLLERLSAWAVALHMSVFDLVPTRTAFQVSREKMRGHRLDLLKRLLSWLALRAAVAFVLVGTIGFLLAEIPPFFSGNLALFFTVTAVLIGIWVFVNSALNAIANGALSDILNEEFDRCLEARVARGDPGPETHAPRLAWLSGLAALFAVGSLFVGGTAFNQVGGAERVDVIGHRGAAASRPENTMAAVIKAIEDGADWVEIDVQETADGEVLVVHDSDFMKAAGVDRKVWDVTMEEVAQIDIGTWFDPIYADERPPLLRDVLEVVKGRSKLIIELKYYGHDVDLENRVIALVEAAGMQDQIATMSLKYPAVQKMRRLRPDWRSGVLAATAVGDMSGLDGDFLAVSAGRLSARLLAQAQSVGKDVYAWTVNDAASMSRMISLGVDGLITDKPKLAREVIAYHETLSTPERLMLRLGDTIGFAFDLTPETGAEM